MRNRSAPLSADDVGALDWTKSPDGLIPAIVQDRATLQVLMLGYMNADALAATIETRRATFFSRSRAELWVKGETSGAFLENAEAFADCDNDAVLVLADPAGPTCHLGTTSCFTEETAPGVGWLAALARLVAERAAAPAEESYTRRLLDDGAKRVAQKVGEEAVETALAGAAGDVDELRAESADLLYHLIVLLHARGGSLLDAVDELHARHGPRSR